MQGTTIFIAQYVFNKKIYHFSLHLPENQFKNTAAPKLAACEHTKVLCCSFSDLKEILSSPQHIL